MKQQRAYFLNSYLDLLTMQETLLRIEEIIEDRQWTQHVVINAGKINLMQENKALRDIVNHSPLINADGQSIVWAGRYLGYPVPERVTGIDLFQKLVEKAAEKGWRLYYFGAQETVVQKVVRKHRRMFPTLQVAGFRNGYFSDEESASIAEEICRCRPDIVFVAFSSPKKELWINQYLSVMQVPFVMGVGGSFDVLAGVTKRAPRWMQKLGLEWLFRLLQEPKRMLKRYVIGNFKFLRLVAAEKRRRRR
ncbi:WecB/TagA/CpsF family glycosyltransferase [Listeria ilorinensis]|uniref:WecB/TagA/CpsF family glycosyltransferase n=1 Tax=Listeria ilorinensis TaxID=2867439 RepID=UPI001EF6E75D|nr:WecB/TagA/CpsF family glycosyltransferase [Listeria ilorinensis]